MNIPREYIDLLLTKIDIVDVINAQVPLRKKTGNNFFACCPFHQEKNPSFSVSQAKQFYYCFGCGASGNAIDFMLRHERLTFPEAIEALSKIAGMEIPQAENMRKKEDPLPGLYELTHEVAIYYYEQMRKSERAIEYLKNRGISGEMAKQFMLGYAQNGWSHLLDHFGKTESERKKLFDAGLIIKKNEGGYYDRFRDRILFPIEDYRGRIIGFGGRIIDHGEPKYLNSPETPLFQKGHELYGLYQALKANRKLERIIIVEGYMDVIALFQHQITYAVATLGTATTANHLQRLFRYTNEIIFAFDGDTAGRTAATRAMHVLFPLVHDELQVRFLFLPEGEDPDSLIRKEGKIRFENRLQKAPSLSTFFFQLLNDESETNSVEGRARYAKLALNQIKNLAPGLFQSLLLAELSKRTRIELTALKEQLKQPEIAKETFTPPADNSFDKNKLPAPLKLVFALLVQHPLLAKLVEKPLELLNLAGASLLNTLIETVKTRPHITTGGLLEYWRDQKEAAFLAKLAQWEHGVPESGIHNEFLGALDQLRLLDLDNQINQLLMKATNPGLSEEEKKSLALLIAKKKAVTAQKS